ncbi:MAG: DUF1934 family protein [Clostridiales bacterium]|jgi:uncharacterized beta-barrel protein YwiB (DUF1934 family)|nr:DUF1934 family protein [Clostridiales bacterium]
MTETEREAKIYFYGRPDGEYTAAFNGRVRYDGESVHIEYLESETERVQLSILDRIVTLSHIGELVYTLILEKDTPASFAVATKLGRFPLTIIPKTVETELTDQNIRVSLAYEVGADDSMTDMRFEIRCELL